MDCRKLTLFFVISVASVYGQGSSGSPLPINAGVVGSNASRRGTAASADGISGVLKCSAASASTTAYTCSTTPTFVPAAQDMILFKADVANTGAVTLNVNTSNAAGVKKRGGGTALVLNDFLAGQWTPLVFDGTNWQMQGQTGNALDSGGPLGTPTSGTATNLTGTASGLTAGAATALAANGTNCSAGSYPLGVDASGNSEGCTALPTFPSGAVVGTTDTQTLTNKVIVRRVVTAADATSVTPNADTSDITYQLNTQATGTLTMNAPTGTPVDGQRWMFKIKSTNVQTYAWNTVFVGGTDVTLPTVSTAAKIDNIGFIYDGVNSKWECVAVARGY